MIPKSITNDLKFMAQHILVPTKFKETAQQAADAIELLQNMVFNIALSASKSPHIDRQYMNIAVPPVCTTFAEAQIWLVIASQIYDKDEPMPLSLTFFRELQALGNYVFKPDEATEEKRTFMGRAFKVMHNSQSGGWKYEPYKGRVI